MKLYRAVSSTELADIRAQDGAFRDSRNLSGEKGFFFSRAAASDFAQWAANDDGERYFIVETEAPSELVNTGRTHQAMGEGAGVYLLASDWQQLTPAVEV